MKPEQVVLNYVSEMGAWEAECARVDGERIARHGDYGDFSRGCDLAMEMHRRIFDRFCSRFRATPRESLSYSSPPEFGAGAEEIIATKLVAPDLTEIYTQQVGGHRKRHLYRLAMEDGQWKLFEKLILTPDGEAVRDEL